jgi:cytochrome c553
MSKRYALHITALFATLCVAAWGPQVLAQAAPPQLNACQACHGAAGVSESASIPNLAGQKKDYLVNQLTAFKRGERKNELMAAMAAQLSEEDMRSLASYFSALPAAGAAPAASTATATSTAIKPLMAFPAAFPQGFTLYETADIPEDALVAKRYANAAALTAARAGAALPEGAVIIVANHPARKDANGALLRDANGRLMAGDATSFAAMESRAGWGAAVPELLRNGNWGYALFGANRTRRDAVSQAECLACHKPLARDSYVFTFKALREAASKPQGKNS